MLIDQRDSVRALRAVHGRFYLATLPLGVGLVGPGLIGGTFLDQVHAQFAVRARSLTPDLAPAGRCWGPCVACKPCTLQRACTGSMSRP